MAAPAPITPEDIAQGEDIDFEEKEEHWNIYKLKDGTTLKVKLVLIGAKRLKKHNPDGTPLYLINSQNVVRTLDIPKELMAKQKEPSFKPV
jgi:hypothetical protein